MLIQCPLRQYLHSNIEINEKSHCVRRESTWARYKPYWLLHSCSGEWKPLKQTSLAMCQEDDPVYSLTIYTNTCADKAAFQHTSSTCFLGENTTRDVQLPCSTCPDADCQSRSIPGSSFAKMSGWTGVLQGSKERHLHVWHKGLFC